MILKDKSLIKAERDNLRYPPRRRDPLTWRAIPPGLTTYVFE